MSSIRPKVIQKIKSDLSDRFRVLDNTGSDKKIYSGQFPDVILFRKENSLNNEALFILKIENGSELVDSLSQWKELASAPSTFYIVVPRAKIDEAKKLVGATGIKARFAWYEVVSDQVTQIVYE
jgi:hypothetical protein